MQLNEDKARQDELVRELTKLDEEIGGIEPGKKFDPDDARKQARFRGAIVEFQMAIGRGDSDDALDELGEKIKADAPDQFDFEEFRAAALVV